ncbi:uncharacterized protein LOC133357976 [Lethenteron reissneri]|uniref:uncharacterized protein LOC133357976 n=1 Tax=Lethenteron reissneri TaxID=7753 RepID=UPI002AB63380|nr:uncharacterized protein LOC133357976 [Lethenteron reissneri]
MKDVIPLLFLKSSRAKTLKHKQVNSALQISARQHTSDASDSTGVANIQIVKSPVTSATMGMEQTISWVFTLTTWLAPLWMALWNIWIGLLITFLVLAATFNGPTAVKRTVISGAYRALKLLLFMYTHSIVEIKHSLVKMVVALGSLMIFLALVCPYWSMTAGASVIFGVTVVSLGASWFWVGTWILMLLAWQLNGGYWFETYYDWISPSITIIARAFVRNFVRERLENQYISPGYIDGLLIMAVHLLLTLPGLFLVIVGFPVVWESFHFMRLPPLLVGITFVVFALVPVFLILKAVCLTLRYIDVLQRRR